jgi:hypothetical protein
MHTAVRAPLNMSCKSSVQALALHNVSAALPLAIVNLSAAADSHSGPACAAPAGELCLYMRVHYAVCSIASGNKLSRRA